MRQNIKSGSFLQKPLETVPYAIYIERPSPFSFCYFTYFSTGCGWGSGKTLFNPWPIRRKMSAVIYLSSCYVHFILLCCLPPMSARLVCCIVGAGAYEFVTFVTLSSTITTTTQQHTVNAAKAAFFESWEQSSLLLAVWDSLFGPLWSFFVV